MAKQKGIIPIEGTIGNITFFKSQDGYMVREKGGVSASKIANDPAFQRTRENNAEFGRAGKAAKLIRIALKSSLLKASDGRMVSRLLQQMVKVIHADSVSHRGERNVVDGNAELLQGFEFNLHGKLSTTLFAPFTASLERSSGTASVSIPSFVATDMVAAPGGCTHLRILMAAASIDFEKGLFVEENKQSDYLEWKAGDTAAIDLQVNLPANSTDPLFLGLGVEFLQEVNGNMYPLKNGAFNAFSLVTVQDKG
jgi:hypothetical protein